MISLNCGDFMCLPQVQLQSRQFFLIRRKPELLNIVNRQRWVVVIVRTLTWHTSSLWLEWWWTASTWGASSSRCEAGGRTSRCGAWSWWSVGCWRTETVSEPGNLSGSGSGRSEIKYFYIFSCCVCASYCCVKRVHISLEIFRVFCKLLFIRTWQDRVTNWQTGGGWDYCYHW